MSYIVRGQTKCRFHDRCHWDNVTKNFPEFANDSDRRLELVNRKSIIK